MKRALSVLLFAAFSLPGQQTAAAPEAGLKNGSANRNHEFTGWMKATASASGALQKMDSKVGKDATERAETLGAIYENMIGYWRQVGAADAVKLSVQGKAAALELASAAHSEDAAKAAEEYRKLSTTCKACHDVHRSKLADGTYMIKMSSK